MIAHIKAAVPVVRYIFETVDHRVHLGTGRGLAGSNRAACVRTGIMQNMSPAVTITNTVSFHHIRSFTYVPRVRKTRSLAPERKVAIRSVARGPQCPRVGVVVRSGFLARDRVSRKERTPNMGRAERYCLSYQAIYLVITERRRICPKLLCSP